MPRLKKPTFQSYKSIVDYENKRDIWEHACYVLCKYICQIWCSRAYLFELPNYYFLFVYVCVLPLALGFGLRIAKWHMYLFVC